MGNLISMSRILFILLFSLLLYNCAEYNIEEISLEKINIDIPQKSVSTLQINEKYFTFFVVGGNRGISLLDRSKGNDYSYLDLLEIGLKKFKMFVINSKDELWFAKREKYVKDKKALYYDFRLDYSKVKVLKRHSRELQSFENISSLIQRMRLIKSTSEIEVIKKAIAITKDAHHKAMSRASSLTYEYQLQAEIEYEFKRKGAYSDAYTSIVACGNSANTLHYIDNNQKLKSGELILIDAGCEYKYYASDITRTIPVNGRYTPAQKKLYNMILKTQLQIIKMIKPGVKRSKLQKKTVKLLSQSMIDLGILKGSLKHVIKREIYKKYYPHGIGHWMGIDVHDEAPYKYENGREIPLKPGIVLTIEPGIYIDENDKDVPKKYRGIGIRIEDDILVTKNGCENLSKDIAKRVEEVESLYSSL